MIKTADLCDTYIDQLQVLEIPLQSFGQKQHFHGEIATLKLFEDNTLVRTVLEQQGNDRVLVIDGGGSSRCALIGDNIAALIEKNNWAGVVVYGCIRDAFDINQMNVGIKALGTTPVKSIKRNEGQTDITVRFGGVEFTPKDYLYADVDGIVVSKEKF